MDRGNQSIELRSEKMRSIIGQVPPALLRYGYLIILGVIIALIGGASILPYHRKYSGVATISSLRPDGRILLRFEGKRPPTTEVRGARILLFSSQGASHEGVLLYLLDRRDTLGRQEAGCTPLSSARSLEDSEVDFTLILPAQSLLRHLLQR